MNEYRNNITIEACKENERVNGRYQVGHLCLNGGKDYGIALLAPTEPDLKEFGKGVFRLESSMTYFTSEGAWYASIIKIDPEAGTFQSPDFEIYMNEGKLVWEKPELLKSLVVHDVRLFNISLSGSYYGDDTPYHLIAPNEKIDLKWGAEYNPELSM